METLPAPTPELTNRKSKFQLLLATGLIVVLILFVALGVISYTRKVHLKGGPKEPSSTPAMLGGEVKVCKPIEEKTQEKTTSLVGKVVLQVRDKEAQLLDLSSKKIATLDIENDDPFIYFSPDGSYIVGLDQIYPGEGKEIIKFFFYNLATGAKNQLIPTFEINNNYQQYVEWAEDSKQFIIYQVSTGKKAQDGSIYFDHWVNYFNIQDLVPHQTKFLEKSLQNPKLGISEFPKESEIVLSEDKSQSPLDTKEFEINLEFSKVNLVKGTSEPHRKISFKAPALGKFSPDYKYYVFVEQDYKNIPQTEEEFYEKRKAYIGYVNVEDKCTKKIEITQVPIYSNSVIAIEQFSEDSKKILLKIDTVATSTNAEIKQWWRMDIATLTKPEKAVNTTINGDPIVDFYEFSSLFNWAAVTTRNDQTKPSTLKHYLLDFRTGKTDLITADQNTSPYSFWLKERPNN